jgi:actin-related protein
MQNIVLAGGNTLFPKFLLKLEDGVRDLVRTRHKGLLKVSAGEHTAGQVVSVASWRRSVYFLATCLRVLSPKYGSSSTSTRRTRHGLVALLSRDRYVVLTCTCAAQSRPCQVSLLCSPSRACGTLLNQSGFRSMCTSRDEYLEFGPRVFRQPNCYN